jgi:hypothetical protein
LSLENIKKMKVHFNVLTFTYDIIQNIRRQIKGELK